MSDPLGASPHFGLPEVIVAIVVVFGILFTVDPRKPAIVGMVIIFAGSLAAIVLITYRLACLAHQMSLQLESHDSDG